MTDLKSPTWIYIKGFLFLVILGMASAVLILENPSWRTAALVGLVAWASARFYHFLFYVIEKYVDGRYKFAGVMSFVAYLAGRSKQDEDENVKSGDGREQGR